MTPFFNTPEVVSEVTRAFDAYEKALVANDVEALTQFFWESEDAVRFGATEELYGFQAISQFRRDRLINFTDRSALSLKVTAFGQDVAVTMYEYRLLLLEGQPRRGRQTQVWVRIPDVGWRITAAHVSPAADSTPLAETYLNATSKLHGPALAPHHKAGVLSHFSTATTMAATLLAFPLPDDEEPAPHFEP